MRNIVEYINESKDKPLYTDYDIHRYIGVMIDTWVQDMRNANIISAGNSTYAKIDLCRKAEIMLTLLECVSDVVQLHFMDAASIEDKKKFEFFTAENVFYRAFKIIETIANMKCDDDVQDEDKKLKGEIKELSDRMHKLVTDCNAKYKKYVEDNQKNNKECCNDGGIACGCPVPCDCCSSTCPGY